LESAQNQKALALPNVLAQLDAAANRATVWCV
jgi:hypothetical protein